MVQWTAKKIGEVCILATGGTPSRTRPEYFSGDIPWLVSGDINRGEIFGCEGRITDTGMRSCNAKLLPKNSVMIALNGQGKTRATVAILRIAATCNQSLVCLTPRDHFVLLPEFLYANLHGRYEELRRLTSDDDKDRRGLNMGIIREIKVPIPPLPEQRRIVAILDEAFEAIATPKANTEKNLQNAREVLAQQLQTIFSEPSANWGVSTLGDTYDVRDGTHDSPKYHDRGWPFITSKNLRPEGLSFDDVKLIADADYRKINERSAVHKGDVLFAMIGTIGNPTVVEVEPDFAIKNVALFKVSEGQSGHYLRYYLSSQGVVSKMQSEARGTTQKFVGLGYLRAFPVTVPPPAEQFELVRQLDDLAANTGRLEAICQRKLAALDELKKSLLHQACTGALTSKSTDQQVAEIA